MTRTYTLTMDCIHCGTSVTYVDERPRCRLDENLDSFIGCPCCDGRIYLMLDERDTTHYSEELSEEDMAEIEEAK